MAVQWSKFESGAAAEGASVERPPETLHDRVAGLYEALREKVFRYLLILGIEPDQAQEICQETFLRLYAKLREGEKIENVSRLDIRRGQELRPERAPVQSEARIFGSGDTVITIKGTGFASGMLATPKHFNVDIPPILGGQGGLEHTTSPAFRRILCFSRADERDTHQSWIRPFQHRDHYY